MNLVEVSPFELPHYENFVKKFQPIFTVTDLGFGSAFFDRFCTDAADERKHFRNDSLECNVYCVDVSAEPAPVVAGNSTLFDRWWNLRATVPFYLVFALFPLLNFQSPTFFTKFNVLGINVVRLLAAT